MRLVFVVFGTVLVVVANLALRHERQVAVIPVPTARDGADLVVGDCVIVRGAGELADPVAFGGHGDFG